MPRCLVADYRGGGPLCIPLAPSPLLHLERLRCARQSSCFSRTSLLLFLSCNSFLGKSSLARIPSLPLPFWLTFALLLSGQQVGSHDLNTFGMRSQVLFLQDILYPLDTLFWCPLSALLAGSSTISSLTHSTPYLESGSLSLLVTLYSNSSQILSGPLWSP